MKTAITTNKGRITSGKTDKKTAAAIVAAAVRRGKKATILAALLIVASAATAQDYEFTAQSIAATDGESVEKPTPIGERDYLLKQTVGALYKLHIDGRGVRTYRKKAELPNSVEFFSVDNEGGVNLRLHKNEGTGDIEFITISRFHSTKVLYLYKD
jgi:hypothetical protein